MNISLQGPVPNINGTSKDELIRQQKAVVKAARALVEALREAAPNGRDYQTVEAERFDAARDQWTARMNAAERILKEAELLHHGLHYQHVGE